MKTVEEILKTLAREKAIHERELEILEKENYKKTDETSITKYIKTKARKEFISFLIDSIKE